MASSTMGDLGGRPDATCTGCRGCILANDRWLNDGQLLFHIHCYRCSICRRLFDRAFTRDPTIQSRLLCINCGKKWKSASDVAGPSHQSTNSVFTQATQQKTAIMSAGQSMVGSGQGQSAELKEGERASCRRCERVLQTGKYGSGTGTKLASPGHIYCIDCFVCFNCGCPPTTAPGVEGESTACFELLDEVFCSACEIAYRNRRYLMERLSCGPPIYRMLNDSLY